MFVPRNLQLKDRRELFVTEAEDGDAAALLEYLKEICGESDFLSFGPGDSNCSIAEELEFIQRCKADNRLLILGRINGIIVGVLSFEGNTRPRVRHAGELGMSVRRDYWNLGIGSRLMDILIEWARESTIVTKLNLRVRTDNDRAVSLYRRKGFIIEGTIRKDFLVDGKYYDHYSMGLELDGQ